MARQLGFLHNSERCVGCRGCEIACKNEYQADATPRWRRVYGLKEDRFEAAERNFISVSCNHCENPECLRVCPVGAYSKNRDGIVLHNRDKCIGCRLCIKACPYESPQFNPERRKVEKCQLCHQKIEKGEKPACVGACIPNALEMVEFDKLNRPGIVNTLPGFPDIRITKPAIAFIPPKIGKQVLREGK